MISSRTYPEKRARVGSRRGIAWRGLAVVSAVVVIVPVIAWMVLPRFSLSSEDSGPMMAVVERGRFVHDITERGNIESANNTEITCKVKSRSGGVAILEVVEEGTIIKPEDCIPEDAVVSLSAVLQLEQWRQEQERRKAQALAGRGESPPETEVSQGARPESGPETGRSPGESEGEIQLVSAEAPADSGESGAEQAAGASDSGQSGLSEPAAGGDGAADEIPSDGTESQSDGDESEASGETQLAEETPREHALLLDPEEDPGLTFEQIKDKLVLVRFNSKEFEDQLIQQQIVCENSWSAVQGAEAAYNTAEISRKEYLEGTYPQLKMTQEAKIIRAQEDLARAQEYAEYSRQLWSKGFITENELRANEFDVKDKQLAYNIALNEMKVLEEYTREKQLENLRAEVETARARLEAAKKSYELDVNQLEEIQEQIVNCVVFARQPGQVVYANETNRWGSNEIVIEPGAMIRERQTILRLPDPTQMQVNAKINEAKIGLVEPGQRAVIRLEASPKDPLTGEVISVGDYPAPTSWYRGDVKEYEVIIKIEGLDEKPRADLRPGFTAEVSIRVAELEDVLQLPIQAVLEHGGKHYCVLPTGRNEFQAKEIKVGLSNDKFVVIEEGLEEGDQVVHNAMKYRDKLDLPAMKTRPDDALLAGMPPGVPGRAGQRAGPGGGGPGAPGAAASGQRGGAGATSPQQVFASQDKNGDGKLEGDEIPAQMKPYVSAVDADQDGAIDRAEMAAALRARAARQKAAGRPGGGPRGGPGKGPGGGPGGGRPAGGRPGGGA